MANTANRSSKTPASDEKIIGSLLTVAQAAINHLNWDQALSCLNQASEIQADHKTVNQKKALCLINQGHYQQGLELLENKVGLDFNDECIFMSAYAFAETGNYPKAKKLIDSLIKKSSSNKEYLFLQAYILECTNQLNAARDVLDRILKDDPSNTRALNNISNIFNMLGMPERALDSLNKAQALSKEPYILGNFITSLHYHPEKSAEDIFNACKLWEQHFPFKSPKHQTQKVKNKVLNIGLISDGFKIHPVGQMIISVLEKLPHHAYQFFAYSSNAADDVITRRFKKISHYKVTTQLSNEALSDQICADNIDILFDLSGYHSGNRMLTLTQGPAPIQIKWVGGLINTTGSKAIDYLISDNNETPVGCENFYTENLVRMPGDYICYELPSYIPPVNSLPALKNGYITFASFNNGMKVNETLIQQWAKILHSVEGSKLYLKSKNYDSKDFVERLLKQFNSYGVSADRLIIEGGTAHKNLLDCYHQVDIALDTWPYSGGLTTCEAFAMGVPVITLPGPTFAGRHSATHLINAGMPELVTKNWDEYCNRATELASDLSSLSVIRSSLRQILITSPVCDAKMFAEHFNNVLRAIWQRHCDGKAPAAVSFTAQGEVLFEGEDSPTSIEHPKDHNPRFDWELEGRVIAIDQGGYLMGQPIIKKMLEENTLDLITFDPASNHQKTPMRYEKNVHYYPNIALGNGSTTTLYACQSPELTGTLRPKSDYIDNETLQKKLTLLAELPVQTAALDKVNDLPCLDWVLLDDLNDSMAALENGEQSLVNTLLLHTKLAFQPTHQQQPNFSEISYWAARHGFRFYCFFDTEQRTPVSQRIIGANAYADELTHACALFIPNNERLQKLSTAQKTKLAFIASTAYQLDGLAYEVLQKGDQALAKAFIDYKTYLRKNPKKHTALAAPLRKVVSAKKIDRPQLTFPIEVADFVRECYQTASTILEYGSGGSTVLASEMPNKQVFSVENDEQWAKNLQRFIDEASLPSPANIIHVNVGETAAWARPIDDSQWRNFHRYPMSIWDHETFKHPDIILIDGRFRVACFVTAALRITKPTTVLFDDYVDRPYYHQVERLAKPVKTIGRMAVFELIPKEIPKSEWMWILDSFTQVTYADGKRR